MTTELINITCKNCGKENVKIVKHDLKVCDKCYWENVEHEVEEYYSDREDYYAMRDEYSQYFPDYGYANSSSN